MTTLISLFPPQSLILTISWETWQASRARNLALSAGLADDERLHERARASQSALKIIELTVNNAVKMLDEMSVLEDDELAMEACGSPHSLRPKAAALLLRHRADQQPE